MFRWCAHICREQGNPGPYNVYDPCCGGGYLATVTGLLNRGLIHSIIASDIDDDAMSLAAQNLELLSQDGLLRRTQELETAIDLYGKESHRQALESARRLADRQVDIGHIQFPADATHLQASNLQTLRDVDIVLADVPYGQKSLWVETGGQPVQAMLASLLSLPKLCAVAIASAKKVATQHDGYRRIKRFSAGHRQISILETVGRN